MASIAAKQNHDKNKGNCFLNNTADIIVIIGNEPQTEIVEVSQSSEGLNVKLFQMLQGSCLLTLASH
jgi:hypothetical protein